MAENKHKKLIKKLERFIPALKAAGKTVALYAVINFCAPSAEAQTHQLRYGDPTNPPLEQTVSYERVHYQVDTMAKGEKRGLAHHSSSNNTITVNHSRNDKEFNQRSHSIETLIHEHRHQLAALNGAYDYPTSLELAYMRDKHDEIAANIDVLLYKRDLYLKTGNLEVFDGFFSYYKDAIVTGRINPKSNTVEDFKKDMSYIANMTKIMWEGKYGPLESYHEQHLRNAKIYADMEGKYKNFWDENYKNSLKIIYNIGGIDFTAFMEKDEEISREETIKLQRIVAQYPKATTLATKNYPVNRSKIAKEAKYPVWSPQNRVSPIQYANLPIVKVAVPAGYVQPTSQIAENIPQVQDENVDQNVEETKAKKKTFKEGWTEFWDGVKEFFKPRKYENPYKQQKVKQTSQKTTQPQQPAQKTVATQPAQQTATKTTQPQMLVKKTTATQPAEQQASKTAQPQQTAPKSDTTARTSDNTPSASPQKTSSEENQTTSRISSQKKRVTKIKINKLKTVKSKKQETPDSGYITPTKKQIRAQRAMERDRAAMERNIAKYGQSNSANNN